MASFKTNSNFTITGLLSSSNFLIQNENLQTSDINGSSLSNTILNIEDKNSETPNPGKNLTLSGTFQSQFNASKDESIIINGNLYRYDNLTNQLVPDNMIIDNTITNCSFFCENTFISFDPNVPCTLTINGNSDGYIGQTDLSGNIFKLTGNFSYIDTIPISGNYSDLLSCAIVVQQQNELAIGKMEYNLFSAKFTPGGSITVGNNGIVACWNGSTKGTINEGTIDTQTDLGLNALLQARKIQQDIYNLSLLGPTENTIPTIIDSLFEILPNTFYTFLPPPSGVNNEDNPDKNPNSTISHIPGEGLTIRSEIFFSNPSSDPNSYYYILLGDPATSENPNPVQESLIFKKGPIDDNGPSFVLDTNVNPNNIFVIVSGNIVNNFSGLQISGNLISFGGDTKGIFGNAIPQTTGNPTQLNNRLSYLASGTNLNGRIVTCNSPLVIDDGSQINIPSVTN